MHRRVKKGIQSRMGNLVGFRHPQFSEDVAWLPAWLQPPATNDDLEEGQSTSFQGLENITTQDCGNSSSADDGRYKSCHLFLSGEDNSQMNFSLSSANGLHFHLHLSLNGNSENTPSSIQDRSHADGLYFDHAPQMHQLETSVISDAKPQCCTEDKLLPISQKEKSKLLDPRSLVCSKEMKPEENVRFLKVADIDDAVELSIAASEALIIHEVIKSGLTTQHLPAAAVLEAALKVKQARLDGFRETISRSIEEVHEIDVLSVLDESTMVDAYEDVGLLVTGDDDLPFCDSVISQVKDTYASENYASSDKQIYRQPGEPEVHCGKMYFKQQLKNVKDTDVLMETDVALESCNGDRKEHIDDAVLGLETTNLACDVNPVHWSVEVLDTSIPREKVDIAEGDATSCQAAANSFPQSRNSEISGKDDKIKTVVPNKFESRWFGGWTWMEEVNDSTPMDNRKVRSIPEHFGGETSFLSESADVAPDENSFVQKQDKGSDMGSQLSIAVESLCGKRSQGILLPEDVVVICPSPSFVDPLCSAVPCSISSENASSAVVVQKQDQVGATKSFSPTPEADMDNVKRSSYQSSELLSEDVVASCPSHSFMDPLCSAVPCSISSENALSAVVVQNHKDQVGATKSFSPTPVEDMDNVKRTSYRSNEFAHGEGQVVSVINGDTPGISMENLKRTSYRSNEFAHGEGQVVSVINGDTSGISMENLKRTSSQRSEFVHGARQDAPLPNISDGSELTIRRQVTILRNYSMLCPSLPAQRMIEATVPDRLIPTQCNLKFLSIRQTPAIDMANKAWDETTKDDAEMPVHMQNEKNSHLNISCKEVSKCFSRGIGGEEYPEQTLVPKNSSEHSKGFQKAQSDCNKTSSALVPGRKRVHFSEAEINLQQIKEIQMQQTTNTNCPVTTTSKRLKSPYWQPETRVREVKKHVTKRHAKGRKRLIFQNIDFLLTGFSVGKDKEIESLIRKYGGMVLSEIPSPISRGKKSSRFKYWSHPVILSSKKLQTTKFLYGCAVNACILKVDWLADSIAVGSVVPPKNYMILPNHVGGYGAGIGKSFSCKDFIFDKVGIMLHGKHKFCIKMAKVVKHGGGMVFKTLHWLVQSLDAEKISVGAIVAEEENRVSRHLKKCASERKIPLMPFGWIIHSLYLGRLLPSVEEEDHSSTSQLRLMVAPDSLELSEEI